MAKEPSKVPVKTEAKGAPPAERPRHPLVSLREEIDRLFEDFASGFSLFPFGRRGFEIEPAFRMPSWGVSVPAVDVVEKDKEYRITAELPGMDEKDIELTLSGDMLSIKGEKREEKEQKEEGYYLSERRYGSFQRSFRVPEGVDTDKVAANFAKGVLTITLPKTEQAVKAQRKIEVKAK